MLYHLSIPFVSSTSPIAHDKGILFDDLDTTTRRKQLIWFGIGNDGIPLTGDDIGRILIGSYNGGQMIAGFGKSVDAKDIAGKIVYAPYAITGIPTTVVYIDPGSDGVPQTSDDYTVTFTDLATFSPSPPIGVHDVKVSSSGYVAIRLSDSLANRLLLRYPGRDNRFYTGDRYEMDQVMAPGERLGGDPPGGVPPPPNYVVAMDLSPDSGQLAWVESNPYSTGLPNAYFLKVFNPGPADIPGDGDETIATIAQGHFGFVYVGLIPVVRVNKEMLAYFDGINIVMILPIDSYYGPDRRGVNNDVVIRISAPAGFVRYTLRTDGRIAIWEDASGVSYYRISHPTQGC